MNFENPKLAYRRTIKLLVLFGVVVKGQGLGIWVFSLANMKATPAYFPGRIEEKYNQKKLCLLPTADVFLVSAIVFAFIVLVQLFHNNFSF